MPVTSSPPGCDKILSLLGGEGVTGFAPHLEGVHHQSGQDDAGRKSGSPKVLTETQREKTTKQLASLNEIKKKAAVFTQGLEQDAELREWISDKASTITIRLIAITVRGSEARL